MIKLFILFIAVTFNSVYGQGYCALRHPQAKIVSLYPDCENYETIISTVDDETRLTVEKHLGFPLYFYEIGRHNLYAIKKDSQPLGIIHSRSEKSQWGLVEIIWALDLELNICNFDFQRCRTSAKTKLLESEFKKLLVKKDFFELKESFHEFANSDLYKTLNTSEKTLANILFKSAIKTIALTEASWTKQIESLRLKKLTNKDLKDIKFTKSNNTLPNTRLDFFKGIENQTYFKLTDDKAETSCIGTFENEKFKILYIGLFEEKPYDYKNISKLEKSLNDLKIKL